MECEFFQCSLFEHYKVNLPYPSISDVPKNRCYAAIVSDGFAGKGSETTAIAQYSVHRFLLENAPDLSEAYQYIAFTEMQHFWLLGNLVRQLGTCPNLYSIPCNQYWNGTFPAQRTGIRAILESDIAGEHDAIAHYNRMICQIDNEQIQALFRRIILDEEKHIAILEGFLNR